MIRAFVDLAENVAILLAKDRKIVYYEDFDYSSETLDVIFSKLTGLGIEEASVTLHGSVSEKLSDGDVAVANAFAKESYKDYRALIHMFSALGVPTVFFYEFAGYYMFGIENQTLLVDQDNSQFKLIAYTDRIQYTSITTEVNLRQQALTVCNKYQLTKIVDVNSLVYDKLVGYFENADSVKPELRHRLALFAYTMTTDSEAYRVQNLSIDGHKVEVSATVAAPAPAQASASVVAPAPAPASAPPTAGLDELSLDDLELDGGAPSPRKAAQKAVTNQNEVPTQKVSQTQSQIEKAVADSIDDSTSGKEDTASKPEKKTKARTPKKTKPKVPKAPGEGGLGISWKSVVLGGVLAALIVTGSSIGANALSKKNNADMQTADTLEERYQTETAQYNAYKRALASDKVDNTSGVSILSKIDFSGTSDYSVTIGEGQLSVVAVVEDKKAGAKFISDNKKKFNVVDSLITTKDKTVTAKVVIGMA